jgi:hypothetical protein
MVGMSNNIFEIFTLDFSSLLAALRTIYAPIECPINMYSFSFSIIRRDRRGDVGVAPAEGELNTESKSPDASF